MMVEKKKNNQKEKIQKAYNTSYEGIKNRILETGPITHASEVRTVSSSVKVESCPTEYTVTGEITEEAQVYNLNFSLKIVIFKMLPEQFLNCLKVREHLEPKHEDHVD